MQHAVIKRDVAARQYGQMQISLACGFSAAWINDDSFERGVVRPRRFNAPVQHGMRIGGIRTRDEQARRVIDIFVAGWWRIRA